MKVPNIHDMYDRHTILIMKIVLNNLSSCIDVGCHVGEILREIIRIAPEGKHYAFEPIPQLCKGLKENDEFKDVEISDFALSDSSGESSFFWIKNDPAYSGLKKRRYDIPNPEIIEIKVKKQKLDDVIPTGQLIDFIKIDVEGGELAVLRGGKRVIEKNKPFIVFESGKGASDRYGTNGVLIFDFFNDCEMHVSTLDGFLTGQPSLTKESLDQIFESTERYYFIGHRELDSKLRMEITSLFLVDLDSQLFSLRRLSDKHDRLEEIVASLHHALSDIEVLDWGSKDTKKGVAVNCQPDGSSAIWIRVKSKVELGVTFIQFGDFIPPVLAFVDGFLITTEIPSNVINNDGEYAITIVGTGGRVTNVGTFFVRS